MAKWRKLEIDPGSEVTGDGVGHIYVTTTPEHTEARSLNDRNKKYIPRSRVVVENKLHRFIDTKKEEIHHKDEKADNDSPSNLELTTHSDHAKTHVDNGKKFWTKSKKNKPGREASARVVLNYLSQL